MKRILRAVFIVALTAIFLGLFLWKSDLHRVGELIRATNPWWLVLAVAANVLALALRALRWRTILAPHDPPPYRITFFATAVGYALSMLLPVRAADVIRPALLSRKTSISFSTALGTILTERVLDLFSMVILFLVYVLTSGRALAAQPGMATKGAIIRTAGILDGIFLLLMIVFMLCIIFSSDTIRRFHVMVGRILPKRFRPSWLHFFNTFVNSVEMMHEPSVLLRVLVLTAGVWMSLCVQFTLVLYAFRRPLPFPVSFFVTGMAIVGLIVPTPAGVGGYHKACQIALTSFYRFGVNTSVAVAFIFHLVGVLPVIVIGLTLLASAGMSWRSVSHIASEVPEEAMLPATDPGHALIGESREE